MYHNTGGVYTSDISATDNDGFYNTITYSLDNDHDGIFAINSMTGELRRTTNQSIPAPAAVSCRNICFITKPPECLTANVCMLLGG